MTPTPTSFDAIQQGINQAKAQAGQIQTGINNLKATTPTNPVIPPTTVTTPQSPAPGVTSSVPTPPAPPAPTQTSTTLAQDQEKSSHQGQAGYDVLGNPIPGYQAPSTSTSTGSTDYTSQADKISQDLFDAGKKVNDTITNIQNGTVPLTPGEQAQIDGLKQQFKVLIDQQTLENTGASGLGNIRGYQTGAAEYDPSFQAKTIGSIVTAGANKIADLNTKMASAVASLTQSFKDDDIKAVKDAWDIYNSTAKDRVATLQKMSDDTAKAVQDARDYAYKANQDAITNKISQDKLDYQESQDAIDNAFKQQQITETQRKDLSDELISQQTALKGRYNRDADGTIYDTATGKVVSGANDSMPVGAVTPGQTGNPLVDANTKYTSDNVPYVDGTNLTGAEATKAQLVAAKMGIPYLSKDGAAAINNIQSAKNDFQQISGLVSRLNPGDTFNAITGGLSRLGNTAVHGLENWTQVGPGATDVSSYKTFKESAIKAIQGLAAGGTGLRITTGEIQTMMDNIPTYNDTKGVAQAKLAKLNAMLSSNEKGLVGAKYYDQYNAASASQDVDTYESSSPAHKSQVDGLLQAYPSLTDSQIMQLVQP